MAMPEKQTSAMPPFLTAIAAADRLGVDERTIRRAIARGELQAVKRSGAFQISAVDLERYRLGRAAKATSTTEREDLPQKEDRTALSLAGRGSLPVFLTSLVGRESEIAALMTILLGPDRLLTLTGPGGVGKTRLAIAASAAVAGDFADGLCYVALEAINEPALAPQAIAHALGMHESDAEAIADRLAAVLRTRRLLLVLDNFEHLVEAAPLVARLLTACPHLKFLVTSRMRLRISGERELPVPPLRVETEAVRLFVERAQAIVADFALTENSGAEVSAICRQLDGLPLAIELAAAWVKVLPPAALLGRLDRPDGTRLPLLTDGPRDMPPRLQTMRDAIAWSYDLLTDAEQASFRCLSVFVGGFTIEAAEAMGYLLVAMGSSTEEGHPAAIAGAQVAQSTQRPTANAQQPSDLDLVASLVGKSLLRVEAIVTGGPRYQMLETIREFGLERLAAEKEDVAVREAHAAWALALAEDAGPHAKQPDAAAWLPRLEAEHPNLRAALGWFLSQNDGPCLVRMAAALWPFWQERGYAGEGLRWLELALDFGREAPAADRLRALAGAGTLAWYLTRVDEALAWHEQALALARRLGEPVAEAFALCNLSWQAAEQGDLATAIAQCEAGLALARPEGATEAMALALHNLACFTRMQGDLATANARAAESLALARAEGWAWLVPMILVGFAYTALELGEAEQAAVLLREGLELGLARGDLVDVTTALEGLARVAATRRAEAAVRSFGAAAALRDEIGMPQSPTERSYFTPILEALQADLGAEHYATAWAAGRSLPRDEAIAEALTSDAIPAHLSRAPAAMARHELTGRELEVLRLLAAGESNRAIAETLFISPTTVASHIASIYGKLGIDSRAKATAFAFEHDLA